MIEKVLFELYAARQFNCCVVAANREHREVKRRCQRGTGSCSCS